MATFDERRQTYLLTLRGAVPEADITPTGLAHGEGSACAALVTEIDGAAQAAQRNLTPLHADEQGLADWGEVLGVPRKGAEPARKANALLATGTPASAIPVNSTLVHRTGLRFEVTVAGVIGGGGTALLTVQAIDTGAATALEAGETLRFEAVIVGVQQDAVLVLDLDEGGTDIEPLGEWRARQLVRYGAPSRVGNDGDYYYWLGLQAGVSEEFVYSRKPDLGSVSVAALHSGTGAARAFTLAERDTLLDALLDLTPALDEVIVLETVTTEIDGEVRISTVAGADWDDSAGHTVVSYDPDTGELVITPDFPDDAGAGDLLVIKTATPVTGVTGAPVRIVAKTAADTVIVAAADGDSAPFLIDPVAGDDVYAGSEVARAARAAILDGYTICFAEGTEVEVPGLNQLGPANPGGVYGEWLADIDPARVAAAAFNQVAVTSVIVDTPAVTREAEEYAFPDTDKVELLLPREWIVRHA